MQNFTQYTPTEIVFGRNTHLQVGKEVKKWKGHRVLIVYGGGSVVKSGLLEAIEHALRDENITYEEFGGVKPNPRLAFAEKGVQKALDLSADFILAVGGGSSIDTAKAIAHGAANPGVRLWDIWTQKVPLTCSLPVGCVLTIAAAGSEMSSSSVLTNEETGEKSGITTVFNRPKFAIMNPELTFTLPPYQIACGVVDIMMHTLERYFIPNQKNQMTDEIAEGLLRVMIENGIKGFRNPEDYDAMSEIMWCGSLSHNDLTGLGREKDFCVHKFGHALGAKYDLAHGATLSAMWGSWAEYVYQYDVGRFCHYGRKVWGIQESDPFKTAQEAIRKTVEYFRSLGMPVSLKELEIGELTDDALMELAKNATKGGTIKLSKIKELDVNDVYQIFQSANGR
ncbi:MAG: iron-containing alcohol dehydrogenase [Bariatricus sp.]